MEQLNKNTDIYDQVLMILIKKHIGEPKSLSKKTLHKKKKFKKFLFSK